MQWQVAGQQEGEQAQIKLQMLQSNMVRVISQNKRLQHLLDYRDYFPRLKQHTLHVASNWGRINALIAAVNELDVDLKTDRETVHSSVNHYYEHINRHIIQQIREYRTALTQHQEKMGEIKNRQRARVRKYFEKMKNKWGAHIKHGEAQTMDILSKAEEEFVERVKAVVPRLAQAVEQEFQSSVSKCRLELGHVQNLLSYYNSQTKKEKEGSSQATYLEPPQKDIKTLQAKTQQAVEVSSDAMEWAIRQMEGKLKGVSGEISWLQSKRRKMRRMGTKQSEQSHSYLQDLTENPKLIEVKLQFEEVETQLMGLGRYCDQMTLEQKVRGLVFKENEKDMHLPLIPPKQQRRMVAIRQKLAELRSKILEFDQFFKNFNL